jgi:hypothetical protein
MGGDGFKMDDVEAQQTVRRVTQQAMLLDSVMQSLSAILGSLTGSGGAIEDTHISSALNDVRADADALRSSLSEAMEGLAQDLAGFASGVAEADVQGG